MPPTLPALFAVLLLTLGGAACDDAEPPGVPPNLRPGGCEYIVGCPTGLVCREGACVGGGHSDRPFTVRIRPGEPLAPVEIANIRFDPSTEPVVKPNVDIVLPVPQPLVGLVTADARAVQVRVTARPQGGIAAQPLVVTSGPADSDQNPEFSLLLAPWWPDLGGGRLIVEYDLRLRPADQTALPPWDVSQARPGEGDLVVDLPPSETASILDGFVYFREDAESPAIGQLVSAFDADGRVVSTQVVTDEEGHFSLRFWRPSADATYSLRLRDAGLAEQPQPTPVVEVPIVVPALGQPSPALIRMGVVGVLQEVEGTVLGLFAEGEAPVPSAQLRFEAQIGTGTLETRITTDAAGDFLVALYPGAYEIDIEPPLESGLRLTRVHKDVVAGAENPIELRAGNRTRIRGQVEDADGPIPGASVSVRLLIPRYNDGSVGQAIPGREHQVEADDDGVFDLLLDPGDHEIVVQAGSERGLPALRLISSVADQASELVDLGTLVIPGGAAVSLHLVNEASEALGGAAAEAWWTDTDIPELAAEAVSDDEGHVTLILPNAGAEPAAEEDAGQ